MKPLPSTHMAWLRLFINESTLWCLPDLVARRLYAHTENTSERALNPTIWKPLKQSKRNEEPFFSQKHTHVNSRTAAWCARRSPAGLFSSFLVRWSVLLPLAIICDWNVRGHWKGLTSTANQWRAMSLSFSGILCVPMCFFFRTYTPLPN